MTRILVGSPVHQAPDILIEFLNSLERVNKEGITVDYCFVDDNSAEESSKILQEFASKVEGVTIINSTYDSVYFCDDYTHRWSEDLVQKVTDFKNTIIEIAKERDYDYLFFIDSDIVLHPKTIKRLLETNKDIVANIFWTKWNPQVEELPQVWLKDAYTLYNAQSNKKVTQDEVQTQIREFLAMLRKPGTYPVGGLGACTLISKHALLKGVNFDPIYNISFWGEDRYFCIRAAALGLQLYVDTYYPAYHIYRSEDLSGVAGYIENVGKRDTEILGSKLLDLIVEGVQNSNKYNYLEDIDTSFLKLFTPEAGTKALNLLKENKASATNTKCISKLQVMECQITFYNNNTIVIATVKYNENGYKNEYSFYKEGEGKCTLHLTADGTWQISEWKIEKRRVPNFISLTRKVKESDNKLTLSMVVKNEEGRYLRRALESAREYIDNAVIIDDGSTDNTVAIVKEVLKDIPLTLIENKESKFSNEITLRKQQWFETIATNPDWILFLDADEVFEDKFKDSVQEMMSNRDVDGYIFRLFDFWDEENYRDDKLWMAHNTFRLFMMRYQKNFKYVFTETAQHCGRMPSNCMRLHYGKSNLRLKHYGWARVEDRVAKYERYMKLDPDGKFGNLAQYKSILDANPTIARWNENEND